MKTENKALEFQFVESWEGWDQIDTMTLQFSNCILNEDVSKVVGYEYAETVIVCAETCTVQIMQFEDSQPVEFKFKASLVIEK